MQEKSDRFCRRSIAWPSIPYLIGRRRRTLYIYNYLSGEVSTSKMKKRTCKYEKVDKALFTYFEQLRAKNIPLSGPLLREKADQYAKSLHGSEASISLSWFERWKVRHGVVCKKVAGEDKSVEPSVVSSWQETTLPTLLSKYSPKGIYNADEFGLFFAALPSVFILKVNVVAAGNSPRIELLAWCV